MRRLLSFIVLTLCAVPAWAGYQSAPTAPTDAASQASPAVPPPGSPTPPAPKSVQAVDPASVPVDTATTGAPSAPAKRAKWEERFAQADLAHDGHLTLEEAKGGYRSVAKHFQEIDVDGKGYITANDIRAWHALQKAKRVKAAHPDNPLRPRNAFRTTASS